MESSAEHARCSCGHGTWCLVRRGRAISNWHRRQGCQIIRFKHTIYIALNSFVMRRIVSGRPACCCASSLPNFTPKTAVASVVRTAYSPPGTDFFKLTEMLAEWMFDYFAIFFTTVTLTTLRIDCRMANKIITICLLCQPYY